MLRLDHPDLASTFSRLEDDRRLLFGTLVVALAFHGGLAAAMPALALRAESKQNLDVEIDVSAPEPEKPPEPPPPEPEPEQPQAEPTPPKEVAPPKEAPAKEPPAAAQAAAVLTAPTDPNEPVDMTGGFVTGTAETYAGGTTTVTGKSAKAVRTAVVAPAGTSTATTQQAPAIGEDRSRPASLGRGGEWSCPWPAEADAEQIDEAAVLVRVNVDSNGRASGVDILQDPGHGFGREARKCAMKETYSTALDRDGRPTAGVTKAIRIRFQR